jgi:hypothetical protein
MTIDFSMLGSANGVAKKGVFAYAREGGVCGVS